MDILPPTTETLNKHDQIQVEQKKLGLKALFKANKLDVWGYECLYCGEFWADYKRKTHTKKCENPHVDAKDKIHLTYKLNEKTGVVEILDELPEKTI